MADVNVGYNINVNSASAESSISKFSQKFEELLPKIVKVNDQLYKFNGTLYTAGVSTQKAAQGFGGLERPVTNANSSLFAMNQIVRDMPFGFIAISNNLPILVDQFTALKNTSGGAASALKSMAAGFMGPAGISIAISAAISLITAWSMSNRSGKDTVEKHKEAVDELSKSIYELRNNLQRASVATLLSDLAFVQSQIAEIQSRMPRKGTMGTLAGSITPQDLKRLEELKQQSVAINEIMRSMGTIQAANNSLAEARISFEKARTAAQKAAAADEIKYYEDIINKENELYGLRKAQKDKIAEIIQLNKELGASIFDSLEPVKETNNALSEQQQFLIELLKLQGKLEQQGNKFNVPKQLSGVSVSEPGKLPDYVNDIKKENEFMLKSFQVTTDIIGDEFKNMWNDVFGEANSLLEKFMQRMTQMLIDIAAQKTAFALFDMLLPGSGSILNMITAGSSGRAVSGGSNVSYVVLDSNVIGTAVTKVLPQSQSRNIRLGRGL